VPVGETKQRRDNIKQEHLGIDDQGIKTTECRFLPERRKPVDIKSLKG